ncbi:hypothetical protein B296_00016914 [Ensete ventricosum]|uniref:Uncharacterized protein n=1 Tax=Ensete ventricosum TaxID=4639 RepID=A0A426ZW60_ENSVE|nr:hypothetical protein B296_00016914 [Ensete ventricosum]
MQCSLISGYFHDFTKERTMMLKVFPDDNLRSTTHDRKKEQEKGIHITHTAKMPSISMLALPERDSMLVLGADTSRVGIGCATKSPSKLRLRIPLNKKNRGRGKKKGSKAGVLDVAAEQEGGSDKGLAIGGCARVSGKGWWRK